MSSNAVGTERISQVVGYNILAGNFSTTSPNLQMKIAILAEANHANQSTLVTDGVEVTSAQQAGQLYGYGSPIYHIMRVLRPVNGGGNIGGIPTVVYAQAEASGSAAKVLTVTVTGAATANATHTLSIAGRKNIDGTNYDINIVVGDDATTIGEKIADAISNVLGSPVDASAASGVVTCTAKWQGLTSDEITISIDTNSVSAGVTYAIASTTAGSGTPSVSAALTSFGNEWIPIVINSYGAVSSVLDAIEAYNGITGTITPTGRYSGIIMKPAIYLTGSTLEDPSSVTDSRKTQMSVAICPAPLSAGFSFEAAANMCTLFARISQDNPQLDVANFTYPDMPTPTDIGSMASYDNRDAIVKKGCSTVDLVNGLYKVMDFVTTYHPVGEIIPQFRYCRNLIIDWNMRFGYYLLEQQYVVGHVISADADVVTASTVVKPKTWKSVLFAYAEDMAKRALIVDAPFMQESIVVNVSSTNPDRLETTFSYKRSGYARIASTTATAGFNFGTV